MFLIQFVTHCGLVHTGIVVRRHFVIVHLRCLRKYQASVDPGPWDPGAVEPSTCSSDGQDREESETFDPEAACLDFSHTCSVGAESLFHLCKSGREILECLRDMWIHTGHLIRKSWDLFDLLCQFRKLRKSSTFSSVVIPERVPVPMRSETKLLDPKSEETGAEDMGTFAVTRTCHEKDEKLQNWVVDTWTKQNQKRSRKGKCRASLNRKWFLIDKGYGR